MLQRDASLTRTKTKGLAAVGDAEVRRRAASDAAAGISADVMLASLARRSARPFHAPLRLPRRASTPGPSWKYLAGQAPCQDRPAGCHGATSLAHNRRAAM